MDILSPSRKDSIIASNILMHIPSTFEYHRDKKAHYKKHFTVSVNFPSGETKIETRNIYHAR